MDNLTRRLGIKNEQYFTIRTEADRLLRIVKSMRWFNELNLHIEPAAGGGAFSDLIPGCMAIDIDPQKPEMTKANFLDVELKTDPSRTLIFGNPPFGRQASLAMKFVKRSCELADYVAFILPRSFQKESTQDKIPLTHSLEYAEDLEENIFETVDHKPVNVKCCFQIWVRKPRQKRKKINTDKILFLNKGEHDFAVQRVGGKAGTVKIGKQADDAATPSHYFIKVNGLELSAVTSVLSRASWVTADLTAGPRSISTQDVLRVLKDANLV